MSSPAATPAAAYPVGRPRGLCHATGRGIDPGSPYVAALRETDADGLERVEYLPDAWDALDDGEKSVLLAHWHTVMPAPDAAKKKLLVDDVVLVRLFRRLGEDAEDVEAGGDRAAFRFVLGLILMRKKLLAFDRSEGERWVVRFRKAIDPEQREIEMLDPKLDESGLDAVGRQVGQLLNDGIDADALEDGGEE